MIKVLKTFGIPTPNLVKVVDRLPDPSKPVLWLDSTGLVDSQEFSTYDNVHELVGFFYDSWIEIIHNPNKERTEILNRLQVDIIEVRPSIFDIAPEREEVL